MKQYNDCLKAVYNLKNYDMQRLIPHLVASSFSISCRHLAQSSTRQPTLHLRNKTPHPHAHFILPTHPSDSHQLYRTVTTPSIPLQCLHHSTCDLQIPQSPRFHTPIPILVLPADPFLAAIRQTPSTRPTASVL